MLYSDNGVQHNYNAKDNAKSNWSIAYLFHCHCHDCGQNVGTFSLFPPLKIFLTFLFFRSKNRSPILF